MNKSLLAKRSAAVVVAALVVLSVVSVPVAASATATADGGDATPDSETAVTAESADEQSFEVSLGSDRTVDIGETLRLEPDVTGANGDVNYDWNYDVDGAYPRESDDESALSLGTMIVPGEYTVTVTATDESGQSVTDTVTVTVTSEFGDAEQIQSDQTLYGDDIDGVYALEAEKGEAVGMVSGGGMRQAILYDENAQPIRTITAGPDTVLQGTTAEYSGTYYLAITSESGTNAELSGYTRSQDQSEPNQGQSEATEISPDTSTTGLLTRSDDSDWYAVEAGEGSLDVSAELSVDAIHQEDIELQIYTEDGRPIGDVEPFEGGTTTNQTYASGAGGMFEAQQSAEITDAGTYYVRVSRPSTEREYTVGFTEYELTVDGAEITDAATDTPTETETETSTTESQAASTESADASDSESTPTATSTTTQTSTPTDSPTTTATDTVEETSTPESDSTEDDTAEETSSSESDSIEADSDADTSTPEPDSTESDADADASDSESDSTENDADAGTSSSESDSTEDDTVEETSTPEPTPTETPDATQTSSSSESSTTTTEEETATTTQTATSEPVTTTEGEADATTASAGGGSIFDRINRAIQSFLGRLA